MRAFESLPLLTTWFVSCLHPLDVPRTSREPALAYCYAQRLADSDGHRRRVRRDADGQWHVEHAAPGREVLR